MLDSTKFLQRTKSLQPLGSFTWIFRPWRHYKNTQIHSKLRPQIWATRWAHLAFGYSAMYTEASILLLESLSAEIDVTNASTLISIVLWPATCVTFPTHDTRCKQALGNGSPYEILGVPHSFPSCVQKFSSWFSNDLCGCPGVQFLSCWGLFAWNWVKQHHKVYCGGSARAWEPSRERCLVDQICLRPSWSNDKFACRDFQNIRRALSNENELLPTWVDRNPLREDVDHLSNDSEMQDCRLLSSKIHEIMIGISLRALIALGCGGIETKNFTVCAQNMLDGSYIFSTHCDSPLM